MKKLRYLCEYIIFLLISFLLRLLSFEKAGSVCAALSRFIGPYLPVSNIARKNLLRIYGANIDIKKTVAEIWDNLGRSMGEFVLMKNMSLDEIKENVTIIGLENIEKFQLAQRPMLFFAAHQANWEMIVKIISQLYPKFALIYRKANNSYIDKNILSQRANLQEVLMIPKGTGGAREIVKAIKNGYSIGMLVDQKMNNGIEVPFFGIPAMTAHAIATLSLQYNYPIIPVQIIRNGFDSKFTIIIHQALDCGNLANNDKPVLTIMTKINLIIEDWIRQYPSQWFWLHNRWKK
jgi:KDO2-lipid IV(A) lauroyltransferase